MFTPLQEIMIIMINQWENVAEIFKEFNRTSGISGRSEEKDPLTPSNFKKTSRMIANVENYISR